MCALSHWILDIHPLCLVRPFDSYAQLQETPHRFHTILTSLLSLVAWRSINALWHLSIVTLLKPSSIPASAPYRRSPSPWPTSHSPRRIWPSPTCACRLFKACLCHHIISCEYNCVESSSELLHSSNIKCACLNEEIVQRY